MEARERQLREYILRTGRNPFGEWLHSITDKTTRARIRTEISEKPGDTGRSFKKIMPTKDYKESLFEDLKDPEFVVAYLNAALEEGTQEVFLLHLRDVADAWGGLGTPSP